jgi:rhamnosyltransferase
MKNFVLEILKIIFIYKVEFIGKFLKFSGSEVNLVFSNKINNAKRICIFYGYQKSITEQLESQLKDIKNNDFRIIYVTNLNISNLMLEDLKEYADVLIQRPNYGRDFAGYKAGYDFIIENKINTVIDLLFTNDTIVFPLKNTEIFWNNLFSHDSVITGPFISYQISKHIQSFFILCKQQICLSKDFKNFWKNYPSPNSRSRVISLGEIGFSNWMLNKGIKIGGIIDEYSIANIKITRELMHLIPNSYKVNHKLDKNLIIVNLAKDNGKLNLLVHAKLILLKFVS